MITFDEILNKIFDEIQKNGENVKNTNDARAKYFHISPAQLSRIQSGKSSLTDTVIDLIFEKLKQKVNDNFASEVKDNLKTFQLSSITSSLTIEKTFVEEVEDFFIKLSNPKSLLCVSYRDFPQATDGGAYPILAEKAGEAVSRGLKFALFQPFGSVEAINGMIQTIARNITHDKAGIALEGYTYLLTLAKEVRQVYKKIKFHAEEAERKIAEQTGMEISKKEKGQVVLYESNISKPLINEAGFQSRLFLANYSDAELHHREIYEWVTSPKDKHFFIERSKVSLNLAALRLQFYPIHKCWETENHLPDQTELNTAYAKYKFENLLEIPTEDLVKWEVWDEETEQKS